MAQYTTLTTREQEAALNYAFEHHGEEGQTKDQFFQQRINQQVLNPMVASWYNDRTVSLEKSIATIPEANEDKAAQEIQAVVVANGGTLVPVGPPPIFPPPTPPVPPVVLGAPTLPGA